MAKTSAHKQLLIALPVFVLIVFAVCKLLPVSAPEPEDQRQAIVTLSEAERTSGGLRFSIDFPSTDPLSGLCVLSSAQQETYPAPPITEGCVISIYTESGKLYADLPEIPGYCYKVEQTEVIQQRQPDGSVHPLRRILLSCEIQGAEGHRTMYLQQLELDITAHTADLVKSTTCPMPPDAQGLFINYYHSLTAPGLPEKHSGSYIQRSISKIVYELAAVDSPESARDRTETLQITAWGLSQEAPYPAQPWPKCWGDHADDVLSAASIITPTLLYLKDNNCFGCAELAHFINSAPFGIIFGDRFTAHPEERVQDTPIEFIPVSAHE